MAQSIITIKDSLGNMIASGTSTADLILSLKDNNAVFGFSGDDILLAGNGSDYLYGGAGNDSLVR